MPIETRRHQAKRPDMRHELRTPLTAILGYGQLLEMGDLDAQQREAVEEILAAGRKLLEMIDGLERV